MEWVELIVPVGELADEVAALLMSTDDAAARGVEVRGGDVVAWAPAQEAEAAVLGLKAAVARLAAQGFAVSTDLVRVVPAPPESEWQDAYKRFFHVVRVTRRLVIVPSWETFSPSPRDVVLHLDPGRAFGTGAHASTRLCLKELERLCDDEGLVAQTFLDVGTGSGILSVAAAQLWPGAHGVAIDIDPEAASAAEENLERNGVTVRVRAHAQDVASVTGRFDVVLANIQADVLELLRDELVGHLAPKGTVVLSGLLSPQADPIATFYEQAGLSRLRISTLDEDPDWSAVVLRAP
jgi:ribosomal protein L11 methyltransferase